MKESKTTIRSITIKNNKLSKINYFSIQRRIWTAKDMKELKKTGNTSSGDLPLDG